MGPCGETLGIGAVKVEEPKITRVEIDRVENGFVVMIGNSRMRRKTFIAENLNKAFSIVENENAELEREKGKEY